MIIPVLRLHEAIAEAAPIDGVSVGTWDDKKTWRIDFAAGATKAQRAAAQNALDAFDPDAPDPSRLVRKSLIIERLAKVGKLEDASKALNADIYARERWYAPDRPAVRADNPEVIALLKEIGADPADILAA